MLTTVTTVTTVTVTSAAIVASLGAFAVVALIALLIMKELGSAELESGAHRPRLAFFVRALNGPIVPLFFAFLAIVAVKVLQVL